MTCYIVVIKDNTSYSLTFISTVSVKKFRSTKWKASSTLKERSNTPDLTFSEASIILSKSYKIDHIKTTTCKTVSSSIWNKMHSSISEAIGRL